MYSAHLIQAIAALLWPIVVAAVVFSLLPVLRRLMKDSQVVDIEVAGTKLSIQSASEAIRNQIADLQDRVVALEGGLESPSPSYDKPPPPLGVPRSLWVDDQPTANVYERARVIDAGYRVVQADSTSAALNALELDGPFEFVVSDMSRVEPGGNYNTRAGLELAKTIRRLGDETLVVFYASSKSLQSAISEIQQISNTAYTSSPTGLMTILKISGSG